MKKIDKLVFGSFIGPFLLTLIVVDFILLLVGLLRYFDELFGKGLSLSIFAELMGYFSISSSPDAFPLAVLLSSIMTFGNLGEHSELTAIKSSGISLIRALAPIFFFVIFLTGVTYYTNTQLVPKVNLKTYSLLWDMRTKKPALDISEGVFYGGIPGYSIKVNEKVTDEHLKDIIIYDHTGDNAQSNKKVILADSGRMYSFMNQRYLALELFDGIRYEEQMKDNFIDKRKGGQFVRDRFESSKMVFDLASFDMGDTDENAFRRSRLVQTRSQLADGLDSINRDIFMKRERQFVQVSNTFRYHMLNEATVPKSIVDGMAYYDSIRSLKMTNVMDDLDTLEQIEQAKTDSLKEEIKLSNGKIITTTREPGERSIPKKKAVLIEDVEEQLMKKKSFTAEEVYQKYEDYFDVDIPGGSPLRMQTALNFGINQARSSRNLIETRNKTIETVNSYKRKYILTRNQQLARSFACMVMFLIGAPIGAIIKKGGLGMPLIVSIVFFLIYYILNTLGEKWGKQEVIDPAFAMWISNLALLPFGFFFLKQARNDARLFEPDFYITIAKKFRGLFGKKY